MEMAQRPPLAVKRSVSQGILESDAAKRWMKDSTMGSMMATLQAQRAKVEQKRKEREARMRETMGYSEEEEILAPLTSTSLFYPSENVDAFNTMPSAAPGTPPRSRKPRNVSRSASAHPAGGFGAKVGQAKAAAAAVLQHPPSTHNTSPSVQHASSAAFQDLYTLKRTVSRSASLKRQPSAPLEPSKAMTLGFQTSELTRPTHAPPLAGNRDMMEAVQHVVHEQVDAQLSSQVYDPVAVRAWCHSLTSAIITQCKTLAAPYRFIAQATVVPRGKGELSVVSGGYWCRAVDGAVTVRWDSRSMHAIVSVFCVSLV